MDDHLQRFNGLDCTAKHRDLAALYLHGTCSWLCGTDEYTTWMKGGDPLLWLQGKGENQWRNQTLTSSCIFAAGSGKSVLAFVYNFELNFFGPY